MCWFYLVTPESAETGSVTFTAVQQQVTRLSPQYGLLADRVYVQSETHRCDTTGHITHIQSTTAATSLLNRNHPLPSAARQTKTEHLLTQTVRLWETQRVGPQCSLQNIIIITSATVSWKALAQFTAVTLCGHVRTWHSDNTALYPCPLFLYCSDPVFCEMKVMFGPWSSFGYHGRIAEGVHKHQHHRAGWETPRLPQHSKPQLIPRLQQHSNITHPGASPELFPLFHLALSSYLSVLLLCCGRAERDRDDCKTISDVPKSTTEGQTTERAKHLHWCKSDAIVNIPSLRGTIGMEGRHWLKQRT